MSQWKKSDCIIQKVMWEGWSERATESERENINKAYANRFSYFNTCILVHITRIAIQNALYCHMGHTDRLGYLNKLVNMH